MTRTYDVKTVGYSKKYYRASIPRGRAADTRAAEVPADYETKARKVDAQHNGWSCLLFGLRFRFRRLDELMK